MCFKKLGLRTTRSARKNIRLLKELDLPAFEEQFKLEPIGLKMKTRKESTMDRYIHKFVIIVKSSDIREIFLKFVILALKIHIHL